MTTSSDAVHDVAVVGAGPAGTAAAVVAGESGARVVLIDSGQRPGGQYYQRPVGQGLGPRVHHAWPVFDDLERRLDALVTSGTVELQADTTVWSASGTGPFRLLLRGGEREPDRLGQLVARTVVVATGAYDRPLPFPGWDLPGVLSGGAAQTLVKSSGVLPGSRVVVAGTGPFLLAVSATLLEAGADVAAVVEANAPESVLLRAPALLGAWRRGGDLSRFVSLLARHRVPYLRRHRVVAAEGTAEVERAIVARVGADWGEVPGTRRPLACDTITVGFGFATQHELLGQLGCQLRHDIQQTVAAVVDAHQRTTTRGVLACGETTGIGGADLALAEGLVAGAAAARAVGLTQSPAQQRATSTARSQVRRLRGAQAALQASFPVRDGWVHDLADDTCVCRCEEVSAEAVRRAVTGLGATDVRTVKLLARAGMGWCQGRMCEFAVAGLCHALSGDDAIDTAPSTRPVATPVPLGSVAGLSPDRAEATDAD